MWVMVILYATTAGQFTCRDLKDCVVQFEAANLEGVMHERVALQIGHATKATGA